MVPLSQLPVPLPNQPPVGYHLEHGDISVFSTTTACHTAINKRDRFLGETRCVICGDYGLVVQPCHIIKPEEGTWSYLRERGWISSETKVLPQHEPRNGLILCGNHHSYFDGYDFFIRFFPEIQKFVFVNYSDHPTLRKFHGKAIALDIKDRHAPFPSLFIIHEMRARGFHPFAPSNPDMPEDSAWQDWILSESVFDDVSHSFKRSLRRAPKRA
ncbi:hypothetical protein M378DRAFT_9375 [Amanita muscaria Koide BX008]|uniref:HNH nuclease domain-containing protein n=1 Tax=Amanita muscaria (strain Koide BX008) TaxID=946122 RepID=A0A0C2XDS1_AMAMK|nr:hypothetical protein M378DRAFT_9375 [Amanita muscaria Koide BX008]